ncbi:Crp/Fnr family transcriptional regulator [Noviherbaspirillum aerium]|uniref:Crp/Fnr family transcriptional regulator n=1 Tax=Noviherbaspirillum aerium TaxID=2588497 RepID=UPI00124DD69E|nr:Crp/Fnr family transcriptional regulator [Noviherbaspirillum aerium]
MQNHGPDDIDRAALLRSSWLSDVPEEILRAACACAAVRTFGDGILIHARGAEADGFYTIASGAVRFTRATADGHSSIIAVLGAPNCFGEISLFDGLPRSHDAHAAGDTTLLFHSRTDFKNLLARYPQIYERFLKVLSMRLRATFDMVEEAAVAPLSQRLARRLLELAHIKPSALNADVDAHGREVPLTQEDLGHLLGKSRQSISKILHYWEQKGLIQTKYGRISIKQPLALSALAYPEQSQGSARSALRERSEATGDPHFKEAL